MNENLVQANSLVGDASRCLSLERKHKKSAWVRSAILQDTVTQNEGPTARGLVH